MKQFMKYMLLWMAMFLVGSIAAIAAPDDDDFDPAPPPDPNQFSIVKVSSEPAGATLQLKGAGQYQVGQSITVSATANANYVFQYWTRNGERLDKGTSFSYTVTTEQATFVAHYLYKDPNVKEERAIYLEADPADGATFNRTNGQLAEVGKSVTCTATLATSFTFLGWYEGETLVSGNRSYTFTMPDEEVHLTARLDYDPTAPSDPLAKYSVLLSADPKEAATLSGAGQYVEGSRVYISASAKPNYTFVNWTLDGVEYSTDRAFYYTVGQAPADFVAHFRYEEPVIVATHKLYLVAEPEDGGTFNRTSGAEVTTGSNVTCTATPKNSFSFVGWYQGETLVSSNRSYTLTMPDEDVTLTAMFDYEPADPVEPVLTYYTLKYQIDGVTVKTESLPYASVIVPYVPEEREGYTFSGWQNLPATMPKQNLTVTGSYLKNVELKYEVLSASAGHGTVSRSTEVTSLLAGTQLTLTAQADEHYHFDHWSDGSTENPHTITVSKDETLTAYFALNTHYVIYKVSGVEVNRELLEYGATIPPYEPEEIEDYTFSGWTGLPADGTMPDADVTVTGSYVYNVVWYEVLSVSAGHGTVTRSDDNTTLVAGTRLTLTAIPDEHYHFDHWSDRSMENPHTILVARNTTITGYFEIDSYTLTYMVDGVEYKSVSVEYGATIIPEPEPTSEGLNFSGWSGWPEDMKMPAHDVVIRGNFEAPAVFSDGTVYDKCEDGFVRNLTYVRSFSNTDWQALYIPFSVSVETLEKYGLVLAELNNMHMYDRDDDGEFEEINLEFLRMTKGETEPNCPYLIKAKSVGEREINLRDVEMKAAKEVSVSCATIKQTFTFTGTYTGLSNGEMYANNYYAMGGGNLSRASSASVSLKPQRWYMSIANKNGAPVAYYAPSFRIYVNGWEEEENVTSVSEIENQVSVEKLVYSIDGRKVRGESSLHPGIYVFHGRKFIIR